MYSGMSEAMDVYKPPVNCLRHSPRCSSLNLTLLTQMEQFVVIDLLDVLKIDSLSSSHPIYVPVSHPDEINQIFDSISYGKVNTAVDVI